MTRELFDKKLRELQDDVLIMGSMVEKAVQRSMEALRTRDVGRSNAVIARRQRDQRQALRARREVHPHDRAAAADGRRPARVVAVLFIATELERMADHAEGIARINLMLGDEPLPRPLGDIVRDGRQGRRHAAPRLTAFVERDDALARQICDEDDESITLYDSSYHALIQEMITHAGGRRSASPT